MCIIVSVLVVPMGNILLCQRIAKTMCTFAHISLTVVATYERVQRTQVRRGGRRGELLSTLLQRHSGHTVSGLNTLSWHSA